MVFLLPLNFTILLFLLVANLSAMISADLLSSLSERIPRDIVPIIAFDPDFVRRLVPNSQARAIFTIFPTACSMVSEVESSLASPFSKRSIFDLFLL